MVLYIDPGTGSMLFTILIGIIGTGYFLLRSVIIKIKFIFRGGKVRDVEDKKIPVVIFSDHKRYWNVFKPICDEFENDEKRREFFREELRKKLHLQEEEINKLKLFRENVLNSNTWKYTESLRNVSKKLKSSKK